MRGQVDGVVEEGVVAAEAGGGPQGTAGLAHLGPVEEALRAPQLVRDPGVGECLLIGLRLGVGPEQDRDLGGRTPESMSSRMRRAAPSASAGSSEYSA